jgi:hypothetical protein
VPDPFSGPARFVKRVGIAYLFGGPKAADLPNLHAEVTGLDRIDEWNEDTDVVWACRGELPLRGVAWYGEWLRGRGTFVARRVLPAALGWMGRSPDEEAELAAAHRLSREAGTLYEVLLTEGPLASMELREQAGHPGPAGTKSFQRALHALQRSLLITHYGAKVEQSTWASGVFEPTQRAFPNCHRLERIEALRQLVEVYRENGGADHGGAARLFRAPVEEVRAAAGTRSGPGRAPARTPPR